MADASELKVHQRIQAFMLKHRLTRAQMAEALGTSVWTMDNWKNATPPACAVKLMDLLEQHPQVRYWLGATRTRERPRGRPFEKGNPWRFRPHDNRVSSA